MRIVYDRRRFLAFFTVAVILYSTILYVALVPKPEDEFIQMYLLGQGRRADEYYPNGSSTIPRQVPLKWYVGLTNRMDSASYVEVRVKFGNLTASSPGAMISEPSDLPIIARYRKVLPANETWEFSFAWNISEVRRRGSGVYLTLAIDGIRADPSGIGAVEGKGFRMIFELWTYDVDKGEFVFGWREGQGRRSAWLQVWFDVVSP